MVLVSGAPGAGKTTLAVPLARGLGFPLFSKDHIKEVLFDSLGGSAGDVEGSRKIGGAAMELLWALAAQALCAVLEANFRPHSEYERAQIQAIEGHLVEVHCRCSPEEASRRFAERATRGGHHPAHTWSTLPPDVLAEYDGPVGIGTVIVVDTDGPVDVEEVIRRVRSAFKLAS